MKRSLALLLPVALVACQDLSQPVSPNAAPQLSTQAQSADPVVPGELIVKLRNGADFAGLAREHGLRLERVGFEGRFAVLRGTPGGEHLLAERLAADSRVAYAEPNYLRQPHGVGTTDPRLWAFYNPGNLKVYFQNDPNGRDGQEVTSLYSVKDADMDADYVGNSGFAAGGSPVVVGSLDTGVDMSHPELVGRVIAGRDWVDNDSDPSDPNGHGTHTSATMAGLHVGVAGVAGAASNVKVFVQRVCGNSGCPTSAIVDAIYAAANFNTTYPSEPPMVAMNLSLGGPIISQSERDAINYAVNTRGVLVIASAGNDGRNRVSCPACDANSISVAATDWLDQHAYYTNWGTGLDISAPGGELYSNTTAQAGILSAVPGNYTGSDKTTGPIAGAVYAYYQGTSMAAPQVTGVAAIVASKTGLRGAALRNRLESTADDLGTKGYDTSFGAGRVNAYRAVTQGTLDESGGGTPPPPPPGDNKAPTANFTYSCANSATCSFTDQSTDSDGTVNAWSWSFGDGKTSTTKNPANTYGAAGTYTVTQTVTDNGGLTGTTSKTITCSVRAGRVRCS